MEYSIVIPAYNEADKITSTLTQVLGYMKVFSPSFEILVVDDGSKDNTAGLVEEYVKVNPQVKIIRNPHKGKGPTVATGIMAAQGTYTYMADADLAAPMSELKKLSSWIDESGYDIVIASREGAGAVRKGEPLYRHIMGRGFNYWVRIFALGGIKDSQCGFKLFKTSVAKDIFSRLKVYNLDTKPRKKAYFGAFDVEILFIARKRGYKIKELPVEWRYVQTTRLNPISDSINMALDVIKVRIYGLKGAYK